MREGHSVPTREELEAMATTMEAKMREIYQDFEVREGGYTIRYRFAIEVAVSDEPRPVAAGDLGFNPPDADTPQRPARDLLTEARSRGLENVAILATRVPTAHAPRVGPPPEDPYGRGDLGPHLLSSTSNAMIVDTDRATTDTVPHETGHMLGLTNGSAPGSIMGIQGPDGTRSLTDADRDRIHQAVQARLPGFTFPNQWSTSGTELPFEAPQSSRSDGAEGGTGGGNSTGTEGGQ